MLSQSLQILSGTLKRGCKLFTCSVQAEAYGGVGGAAQESATQHEHHAVLVGEKRVRYCQLALGICCPCYNQLLSSSEYMKPLELLCLGENEGGFSLPLHECAYGRHSEEPSYVKITLSSLFGLVVVSDNGANTSCSAGEASEVAFRKSL